MTNRREFLQMAGAGLAVPLFLPETLDEVERRIEPFAATDDVSAARTEDLWDEIRRAFHQSPDFINLENGYFSPQPAETLRAFERHVQKINETPSFSMRREKADDFLRARGELARLAGCPVEELTITRNTTESMSIVIHGLDLEPGDEAVMTNQDYGSMLEEFRQEGGDYFGASLHKWLCTPIGAGILQMRPEKIAKVWPLFGETSVPEADIRKFERYGTTPLWTVRAISDAIRFHTMVGPARKEARLRYLQEYWTSRAREIRGVTLNTPTGERACAIANFAVTGRSPAEIADILFDRYRIFTVAIDMEAVKGVRVTPHIYTRLADLDALVAAIRDLAA